MKLEEFRDALKEAGCLLVQVENQDNEEERSEFVVKGSIEDYIAAVIAVRSQVVFVQTDVLEEEEFHYLPERDEDDESADAAPVDLCTVEPRLSGFKQYVGRIGMMSLTTPLRSTFMSYVLEEEWHGEFVSLWELAVAAVDNTQLTAVADEEAREAAKNQQWIGLLRGLIENDRFVRLPTQRAMMQFALKHIPGLDTLDRDVIRSEIQDLVAKLQARTGE